MIINLYKLVCKGTMQKNYKTFFITSRRERGSSFLRRIKFTGIIKIRMF